MLSIADRIQRVLDSGKVRSGSAWCISAGLPRTYISRYMHQNRQGNPSDMGVSTVIVLAQAAGISPAWLAFGYGPPEDIGMVLPPNLVTVLSRFKGDYVQSVALQAAMIREILGERDLPEQVWRDYLDDLKKLARRVGLELAVARLDDRGVKG